MFRNLFIYHNKARKAEAQTEAKAQAEARAQAEAEAKAQAQAEAEAYENFIRENGLPRGIA